MITSATFYWPDYLVFSLTLALSASIGIYYGILGRKKQTVEEYLMAGRNMHPFPVALSLFVTYMSAISFIGDPAEVYTYGGVYIFQGVGYVFALLAFGAFFAPVYQDMKLTSVYEYLERRFHHSVRLIGTALNLSTLMYSGIALYAPSIALSQVVGVNLWAIIIVTGSICTIYTTLGGMKAVLWADSAQLIVMLTGVIILLIKGSSHLGGFTRIFEIASEGGRLNFWKFDPSPFLRASVWTYLIGGFFRCFMSFVSSQSFAQRVCTVNTKKKASLVAYLNIPLFAGIVVIFALMGLLLFAYFHDCDPFETGQITKKDQLLPLLMTEVLHFIPGLPGLFLACLFCAALSTLSSVQNGLATNFIADIFQPIYAWKTGKQINDRTATCVAKLACFVIGILNIMMAILMDVMGGTVFKTSLTVSAIFTSPKAGVFMLGIFSPVDTFSAMTGAACALVIVTVLGITPLIYPPQSQVLPVFTYGCNITEYSNASYPALANVNQMNNNNVSQEYWNSSQSTEEIARTISNFSPLFMSTVGVTITVVVGLVVGYVRIWMGKGKLISKVELDSEEKKEQCEQLNKMKGNSAL